MVHLVLGHNWSCYPSDLQYSDRMTHAQHHNRDDVIHAISLSWSGRMARFIQSVQINNLHHHPLPKNRIVNCQNPPRKQENKTSLYNSRKRKYFLFSSLQKILWSNYILYRSSGCWADGSSIKTVVLCRVRGHRSGSKFRGRGQRNQPMAGRRCSLTTNSRTALLADKSADSQRNIPDCNINAMILSDETKSPTDHECVTVLWKHECWVTTHGYDDMNRLPLSNQTESRRKL